MQSKNQINRAGEVLKMANNPDCYREINEWRSMHNLPLNNFRILLQQRIKRGNRYFDFILAQRLKRMPTIKNKLLRYPEMQLSRMQDIGGMRAIGTNLKHVNWLEENLKKINKAFKYISINNKNYIQEPKSDGYRGIHVIYKYNNTQKEEYKKYNGIQIELQIRTELQHLWATGVETVDALLIKNSIKEGEGDSQWRTFFRLLSSFFAIEEGCQTCAEDCNLDKESIANKIRCLSDELKIVAKFESIDIINSNIPMRKSRGGYYVLLLDRDNNKSTFKHYTENNLTVANEEYLNLEKDITNNGLNKLCVLVSVKDVESLKQAYPNYFFNIKNFLEKLKSIIKIPKPTPSSTYPE